MRNPRQGFACVTVDRGPLEVEVGIELRLRDVLSELEEVADTAIRAALSELPVYGPTDRIDDLVVAEHVEARVLRSWPDRSYRIRVAHRRDSARRHHVHVERIVSGEARVQPVDAELANPTVTPSWPEHAPSITCRCAACEQHRHRRATAATRPTVELPCLVCGAEGHAARLHVEQPA